MSIKIVQNQVIDLSTITKGTNITFSNNSITINQSDTYNGSPIFEKNGSFETPAFNFGKFFLNLKTINTNISVPTGTSITVYTATSNDNVSYSPYVVLNGDGTIASPSGIFLKVKVDFTAKAQNVARTLNEFDQSESSQFDSNSQILFNGSLGMKNAYLSDMVKDTNFSDQGILVRKTINKSSFFKIDKIEVL